MPYLTYETVSNFQKLQDAVHDDVVLAKSKQKPEQFEPNENLLIEVYINPGGVGLHIRRSLDQFYYPNFDTSVRDRDQVVCRHQRSTGIGSGEPKLYMVDQLWVLILDSKLVITSMPERRKQTLFRVDPSPIKCSLQYTRQYQTV
jgi:hypothetical protein